MFPGQTCAPQRLQGPLMENKILGPPFGNFDIDFLGGSSRKRKSTAMDQPGSIPWQSNLQRASMLSGTRVEENPRGLYLNQKNSIEPPIFKHPFEKDQFHYQNCYSGSWGTSNGNFHANATDNLSNDSSYLPPESLDYKRSCDSVNRQAGECIAGSNWQAQGHNALGPSEAYTSPFSKSYDAHTGKPQVASHFEELMSFGIKSHVTDKMPLGLCNTPSETLRPGETLQHNFLKPHRLSVDMGGRTCPQEDSKSGISCEMRQCSHSLNNRGTNDVPTVGSASVVSSQNQNHRLLQNEVQFGSSGSIGVHLGEISENEGQSFGDGSVKIEEKTEASDMKNLKHPLSEEFLPKNVSPPSTVEHGEKNDLTRASLRPDEHGEKNDLTRASLRPDEKSKLHFGKAPSVVAEKLWEGSLQLSSSVVVAAVAFFKSGEKLLDTNWCESVEVKGKVRLEAFEKYIQDLPRSRNRGLMVISLCWKEESSETGLTGMKEVAKGYKKTERVGFAQLSPGIDLYICPRSEAIITILAKYGFFKGMAAVEDNQDSMIGCVVWRRNRTSSNSVSKKPENKSNSLSVQPLNSPSDSPVQKAAEKPVTQPAQESLAPASVTATSIVEGAGKYGSERKNINSGKIDSVPSDSTSNPEGFQRPAGSNSASLQEPQGDLSEVEAHPTGCSGPEQPKASLELQELPSNIRKETMPSLDDDDLPEFDFTAVCGISQTNMSKPSDTVMLDKRFPTEGIRKTDRSVPPGTPNVQAMSVSSQRSDHSMRPRLHLTENEGMPPLKIYCERESQVPVFPSMEERLGVQNKVTTALVSATAFASPKNLFDDDDDDMPEWCPPGLRRRSLAETTRPSTAMPSELPKSNFQNLACGPPRPELPSPLPAATRPSFSSQAFPPTFHCPTIRAPLPLPRPLGRGPSSSMGINSNSVLGPPPRFDFNLPFRPPDKRGRRP